MRKQAAFNYFFYCFIISLCSSCSTQIRWPQQNISLKVAADIERISVNNNEMADLRSRAKKGKLIYIGPYRIHKKPGRLSIIKIAIPRSKRPIPITIYKDSIQKTVMLSPHRPLGWLFNMHCICGVKDSINAYGAKCWTFPRKNYIYFDDTAAFIKQMMPHQKGNLFVTLSAGAPVFSMQSDYGHYNSAGVLAPEIGLQYFYQTKKFISFAVGAATDVLPLPIEHLGGSYYYERAGALYASVRNNLIINDRLDIGYGLQLSKFFWTRISFNDSLHPANSMYSIGLGPSIAANYRVTPLMHVGVLYQPILINLNDKPAINYQHYLALRLTIGLKRKK